MKTLVTLGLLLIPKVSRKTVQLLFMYNQLFDSQLLPKDELEVKDLFIKAKQFDKRVYIPNLDDIKAAFIKAESIIAQSEKHNIEVISILDDGFPPKLKAIDDPPVLIFIKGNKECLFKEKSVAIIGTRKPTEHGEKVAEKLGRIFTQRGYTVVSGLAIGCDTFAHLGCVKEGGSAIAVLPCGLDKIYPASNRNLAENILKEKGCLISEYYIGQKPYKNFYVDRDRLQSALSKAVIVVETDVVGGTMHTVKFALQQKKVLVCYQHPEKYLTYKQTQGNMKLIDEGKALPIKDKQDIEKLIQIIDKKDILQSNNKISSTNKNDLNEQLSFL